MGIRRQIETEWDRQKNFSAGDSKMSEFKEKILSEEQAGRGEVAKTKESTKPGMMRSKSNLTESTRKTRMSSEEREKKEKGEGGLQRRASKKLGSERKGREAAKKSVMLLGEVAAEGQAVTVIDETEALEIEKKREEDRVEKELEDQRRRDEEMRRKSE